MDLIATLGRTAAFSLAAGLNLYATMALMGLASRFDWVTLPPQFRAFDTDVVIGAAVVLYLVEFVADKVPYVDSVWDIVHTAIRPVGGALIAATTLGEASPVTQGLAALIGGTSRPAATSRRPARARPPTPALSRCRTGPSALAKTAWSWASVSSRRGIPRPRWSWSASPSC